MAFAYFQPGTVLVRRFAAAILVLAVAYFGAGFGQLLPRWMTVIGTNILLLSSSAILYTGLAAYCEKREATLDRLGWGLVAFTVIPFWYWGLVDPNGQYRSVVFSFAAALINVRSAFQLLRKSPYQGSIPVRALGILFGVLTVWMFVRGIVLLGAEPAPQNMRGANPTGWVAVFCYIVLISLVTAAILWMEVARLKANYAISGDSKIRSLASVEPSRANLLLLWSIVAVLCIAIVSEVVIAYGALSGLHSNVTNQMQPISFAAVLMIIVILTLAAILTVVIRQRDEQENFMSMLSHELKTPLSVIHMTLGGGAIPVALNDRITRAVTQMDAIIERCVQADRLHNGLIACSLTPCRIDKVFNDILLLHATSGQVVVKADNLPTCVTDIQLINVILSNLLDNALKYGSSDHPVEITADVAVHKGREGIRINVTNIPGSAGIPDPKQVFRKFYRAPGAHSKTGSGLGLHISAGFARKIGGVLRYQPTDDKVKFELWIPL